MTPEMVFLDEGKIHFAILKFKTATNNNVLIYDCEQNSFSTRAQHIKIYKFY